MTADEFQQLARRVREADIDEVWEAFGRDVFDMATGGDRGLMFAGVVLEVSPEYDDLGRAVRPVYRQYGDSRSGLRENAVAEELGDAYAVVRVAANNRVLVARNAVAGALERESDTFGGGDE